MNLNDLFPLMLCTNMSYRPDRWTKAQQEFSKLNLNVQRIDGVVWEGTNNKVLNGQIGCGLAHLNGLKLAKELNTNVLMLEDDCMFINNYQNIITKALEELPDNWDMFYLGANVCRAVYQVSDTLGKLTHAQSTHAYGVNKNFLDKILDLQDRFTVHVIDVMYGSELVPNNNCYITIPMIAIQRADFSNIENKNVDYSSWMEQRFYEQLIRK